MPTKRLSMRKIKEVLRLNADGLSQRQIARSCAISRGTVLNIIRRAEQAGIGWPLPDAMSDEALETKLYPPLAIPPDTVRPVPDWPQVYREMKRKSVTLYLLWEEYRATHPTGYQYTWFCIQYRAWLGKRDVVMRQNHRAGEKLFVDYAGQTVPVVIDADTGEVRDAQVFVAVLGASNYTYAEATWTQGLSDWIGSHIRTFDFLGGVVEIVVPDNLKSGVRKPCRYEPELNPTYQDLAVHYGTTVLPARVRKPRDKSWVS